MLLRDLFEAPISDFHHIGNFDKSSSFKTAQDRKLVTAPKALEKIRGMWKYPEESLFNIIFINHPDVAGAGDRNNPSASRPNATHFGPLEEIGVVDVDWLEDNMPRCWPQLEKMLNHDQINVIYTNNSGSERVPMTGWIMAHRLGHGLLAERRHNWGGSLSNATHFMQEATKEMERGFKEAMACYRIPHPTNYYGTPDKTRIPQNGALLGFIRNFCTFKSARESNVRNPFEVVYECLAQYMMTGKVTFNDLPRSFKYGNRIYSFNEQTHDYDRVNMNLKDDLAFQLQELFETALGYCEGKIILM